MKLDLFKSFGLVYLATPFTLYEAGLEAAFIDASRMLGKLLNAGVVNVTSPIVEAYPASIHGNVDPLDLSIWMPFCAARMGKSGALIVGMLDGWENSIGTRGEIKTFRDSVRPVFYMNPADLSFEFADPLGEFPPSQTKARPS